VSLQCTPCSFSSVRRPTYPRSFPPRRSSDLRKRAPRTGHGLRKIVAGDVLDHASAGLEGFATPGNGTDAKDMIAGRTRLEAAGRSEEHTSELQSRENLVCSLLLEKKETTLIC